MQKLTGYRACHRNRWLLLKNGCLSLQEFLLFEFYLDQMDFDSDHSNFGCFEAYFDETSSFFLNNPDTIRIWHDGLLNKSFIELHDKRRCLFRVKHPEKYVTNPKGKAANYAKEEKSCPTLGFLLENSCFFPEKLELIQKNRASLLMNNTSKTLGSSKDVSRVIGNNSSKRISVIRQKPRTEEEYQKIHKEGGFSPEFTPDDMEWIDKNVTEKIEIENDQQEKEIVGIFFNNDWNAYQQSLIN